MPDPASAPRALKTADGWPLPAAAHCGEPLPVHPLERLVYYARFAPSSHNAQPWRFLLTGEEIEVFADEARWPRIADPDRRELMVSVGCAIELLRIAADFAQFGTRVKYFPVAANDSLVARIQVLRDGPKREFPAGGLLDHCVTRRTSHRNFEPATPVSDAHRKQLYGCFEGDQVSLHFLTARPALDALAAQELRADAALFANPAYREELAVSIGEGLLGLPWLLGRLGRFAVAHLPVGDRVARGDAGRMSSAPLAALLTTREDRMLDRVHAGEAYMRIALLAESHAIRVQPVSQLLEDPGSRATLASAFELHGRVPQHLFRLGHAEPEPGPPRRRPLDAVLARGG